MLQQVSGGADAREQQFGTEAGDERAVAPTHVEHSCRHERTNRLANGTAAGAERLGEFGLGRQALTRDQFPGRDEEAHPFDGGFGQWCCHGGPPPRRISDLTLDI